MGKGRTTSKIDYLDKEKYWSHAGRIGLRLNSPKNNKKEGNKNMNISLSQQLNYSLEGVYDSLFVSTSKKLKQEKYKEALKWIAPEILLEKYQSPVDFLFCEIFLSWRSECFRFYQNNGPGLITALPKELRNAYDRVLSELCLELALIDYKSGMRISWANFKKQVEHVLVVTV